MPRYKSPVKKALLPLLLLSFAVSHADEVDDLIKKEMEARHIPGMSVLVTKNDQVVKRSAYGIADIENNLPMTTDYVMESGSIGKAFTATVIMQLVEEGKLSLDDTLETRLQDCPAPWRAIKIRELLGQVTGLPDYAVVPGLGLIEHWTKADWLKKLPTVPFDFPTGTAWAYSNSNYLILGLVAEKVTGKPIIALVFERIFRKLELKHSYVADQMIVIPHRAHGYLRNGSHLLNGPFIAPGYGDGSFINSCEDLASFEKGIREGKLLKPETVAMMQTAGKLPSGRKTPYGFAWFVREVNKIKVISHGGNTAGFFASLTRVPSENLTVVVMGNVNDISGDPLALKVAETYVPGLKYIKLPEKPDPDPALTGRLLELLTSLADATPKESLMEKEFIDRLKTGRGKMSMEAFAPFKGLKKLAFLEKGAADLDTLYRYRAEVGGKTYLVVFALTKDGKVNSVGTRQE